MDQTETGVRILIKKQDRGEFHLTLHVHIYSMGEQLSRAHQ